MKKSLTKIKLINWHGFYDQTIDVKGSMLVFGENGSGKSSLLDALMFFLTGGEEKFFNSAANDRASRTAESYMRAKIGIEGKENLRNQPNVISHIALEWFDEYTQKPFVTGVCLEIQEEKGKVTRSFYYIEDRKMSDDLFVNKSEKNTQILSFQKMMEKLGEKLRPIEGTRDDIRMKICSLLSIETKRYYELLPKAVAFRPIRDVNQFVYQFLMPDKAVDLTNMKRNIFVYNELQKRVEEDIKKEEELGKITRLGDTLTELSKEMKLLSAHRLKKEVDNEAKKVEEAQATIEKNKKLIGELEDKAAALAEQLRDLEKNLSSLQNPESEKELLSSLIKEKSALEMSYLKKAEAWNETLKKEVEIAKNLKIKNKLADYIGSEDFAGFIDEAKKYHETLLGIRNKIAEQIVQNDMKINAVSAEESELVQRKNLLSRGLSSYDPNVTNLIQVIQDGLKEIYHKEILAKPFCELLDMEKGEEEWRNAVEGYLNTRRFDLFVPEEYFDDALRLYERNKNRLGIYGVGLVNVSKLRDLEPLENSLALKVHALNQDARRYADYIMGNIICVDSEDELKNYESSITRTVMIYKSKAARQTKQRIYETPFIGCNASRMQLELAEKEVTKKEAEYHRLLDEKASLEALRRQNCDSSKIQVLMNDQNWYGKYVEMRDYVDSLKAKLAAIQTPDKAVNKENDLLKEKDETQKKRDAVLSEKSRLEYENDFLAKSLAGDDHAESDSGRSLKKMLTSNLFRQEFEAFEKENAKLGVAEVDSRLKKGQEDVSYKKALLTNLMQKYIDTFKFDATSSIDSLPSFYQEKNILTSRALMEDQAKLEKAKKEATNAFENNYIDAIRANIINEEEHIKSLNKLLANKPFGTDGDIYRFIVTKSKDKAFGDYYDIFKGNENFVQTDLFGESLNDRNKALMNELFMKLASNDTDEKTLQDIAKYCDYRRFMNYDIEIINKNGHSLFSKISREKSGGETQTPFYVIIAASFDQIIRNAPDRKSHGCLVLFDEAFNNMDAGHIEGIMEYFKQLDAQLIIATPTERGKTIAKYVDTNVLTIKVNNVIETRPFISLNEEEVTRKFEEGE